MHLLHQRPHGPKALCEVKKMSPELLDAFRPSFPRPEFFDMLAEARYALGHVVYQIRQILPLEHLSESAVDLRESGSRNHQLTPQVHELVQPLLIHAQRFTGLDRRCVGLGGALGGGRLRSGFLSRRHRRLGGCRVCRLLLPTGSRDRSIGFRLRRWLAWGCLGRAPVGCARRR